jgi:NADH-quinone oxidoreductase subunit L
MFPVMITSSLIVFLGLGLGWWFYGRKPIVDADAPDNAGRLAPPVFSLIGHAFYIDAFYNATFVRLNTAFSRLTAWFDRWVFNGAVQTITYTVLGFAHLDNFLDTHVVNGTFDEGCEGVSRGGYLLSLLQAGRVQSYLKYIGIALIIFTAVLLWRAKL